MEAAKEQLRTFNDLGKNPKYEWIRTVGGSADRCQYFSCGAHVDCPVKLKAYIMGDVFLLAKLQDMDHADEIQCYDRANASLTKDQKAKFKLQKACPGATASFIMKRDQQGALQAGARPNSGEEETGVEGVAALEAYQNQARYLKRAGKLAMRSAPKLENRSDLLNFMRANPLPATLEEMEELKTYTVDGIAAIWDMFEEADGSKVIVVECIQTHSNAFERIRTHLNAYPLHAPGRIRMHLNALQRIRMHMNAFIRIATLHSNSDSNPCILMHVCAFACIPMHYAQTLAVPLISKHCVGWIGQLVELTHAWALHGDGKHKLHIGGWPLITWGTHCLKWDATHKCYRHSYRPLIYLFSKNVETTSAGRMAMVALQLVAVHFFGKRLKSDVNISDCSAGLMAGMQYLNIDHTKPDEEEFSTPHLADWAHLSFHYTEGDSLHAHAIERLQTHSDAF